MYSLKDRIKHQSTKGNENAIKYHCSLPIISLILSKSLEIATLYLCLLPYLEQNILTPNLIFYLTLIPRVIPNAQVKKLFNSLKPVASTYL